MAVLDFAGDVLAIPAGATVNLQPAAGDTWRVQAISFYNGAGAAATVCATDGICEVGLEGLTEIATASYGYNNYTYFFDNDNYIRINSGAGGVASAIFISGFKQVD